MKELTKDTAAIIAWTIFWCALITIISVYVWWYNREDSLTLHHSSTLIDHNQRLIAIEYHSWDTDKLDKRIDLVRDELRKEISSLEQTKVAKIYNLEITICRTDKIDNVIEKRKIRMDNVVAINPSVEHTATLIDTWLGDGRTIQIPDYQLMMDTDTYACDLKILSVK